MYEKRFSQLIEDSLKAAGVKHCVGDLFWINNSSPPSITHVNMARGLSNDRVCYNGISKTGISELMAVQHRNPSSPHKLTSAMIGIVSDAVVRAQKKTEPYKAGVQNLFNTVIRSFESLQAA